MRPNRLSRLVLLPITMTLLFLFLALMAAQPAVAAHRGMMLGSNAPTADVVQQVQDLAAYGADIVRFPVYFDLDSLDAWLAKADAVLSECERDHVTMVVDFHHVSENPTPGLYGKPEKHLIVYSNIESIQDFQNRWTAFARRFRDRGALWYDLGNEPTKEERPSMTPWPTVALRVARAIRQYDTRHTIVYAPSGLTTRAALTAVPLPGITNQILEFHFYDWPIVQYPYPADADFSEAHYPASLDRTRQAMSYLLDRVRAVGDKYGIPVYIGEVAISRFHPDAARFLSDFTSLCDQKQISLTIHCFREDDHWNYEPNQDAWRVITNWMGVDPAASYEIRSVWSGKCLDVANNLGPMNGVPVQQWDYLINNKGNQKWNLIPVGNDGYYQIRSVWSGKCLDVANNLGPINGARLQQWGFQNTPNEIWRLQPVGWGHYEIVSLWSGKCLDVSGSAGPVNGAPLDQWEYWGGPNQQFALIKR